MKLQLAFDFTPLNEIKNVLREIGNLIDIVELGTPLIIKEGIKAIREIKKEFCDLPLLADLKIMDGGEYESRLAFEAGADFVTVLGLADNATINSAVKEADKYQKGIVADLMGIKNVRQRALEIEKLGVQSICIHTAIDVQSADRNPILELKELKSVIKRAEIAVAGGINLDTIVEIAKEKPDIVVVGSAITGQINKTKPTMEMKRKMEGF